VSNQIKFNTKRLPLNPSDGHFRSQVNPLQFLRLRILKLKSKIPRLLSAVPLRIFFCNKM